MRRLNIRLMGILLLSGTLLAGAAYAVHEYQVKRNAGSLLVQAERALANDDLRFAMDNYARYAQLVPQESAEPLAKLGVLQADAGQLGQAYRSFEQSLFRNPRQDDIRHRQVELALGLRRYAEARQHIDALLPSRPQDGRLRQWRADCEVGLAHFETAEKFYKEAIETDPGLVEAYARRALNLHDQLKSPLEALHVLNAMVEANPEIAQAYVLRGAYRLAWLDGVRRGDFDSSSNVDPDDPEDPDVQPPLTESLVIDEIVADARTALRLSADDESSIQFAMSALFADISRRKPLDDEAAAEKERSQIVALQDEIRELGKRGIEHFPKSLMLYTKLADLEIQDREPDAAIQWLTLGLENLPKEPTLLWNLATLLAEAGRVEEAQAHLATLQTTDYPVAPVKFLAARLLVAEGDWKKAAAGLEAVRATLVSWPMLAKQADFLLGKCYQRMRRPDLQLSAYRRASSTDPEWVEARVATAEALFANGQIDEAINEYVAAARMPNVPVSVLLRIPQLIMIQNRRRAPAEQNWTTVSEALEHLKRINGNLPQVVLLEAEMLLARNQEARARQLIETKVAAAPEATELWLALAALAERRGEPAVAGQLLQDCRSKAGDSIAWRLAKARHTMTYDRSEAAEEIARMSNAVDDFSTDEQAELLTGLAVMALSIRDLPQATRLAQAVIAADPKNLQARLVLLEIASGEKNLTLVTSLVADVESMEGEQALAQYFKARKLVIESGAETTGARPSAQLDEAKRLLIEAQRGRPTWSAVPLLLGQIYDAEHNADAAIQSYAEAIRLGERSLAVVGRTSDLMYRAGRFAEANDMIRLLQDQKDPLSGGIKRLAADIALRVDDTTRAVDIAREVARESKDSRELVWAGRILESLGENSQAEASYRRAIDLTPAADEPRIALVQYYSRQKETQKVEDAIAEAEEKIQGENRDYVLGEMYESIGRMKLAEERFLAASDAARDDVRISRRVVEFLLRNGRMEEAEEPLRRLIESKAIRPEIRAQCRRELAFTLAQHRSEEDCQEALEILAKNKDESLPEALAAVSRENDLRTRAAVLTLRASDDSRQEAVKILEPIVKSRGDNAPLELSEEQFLLAQLYWSLRQKPQAMSQLKSLVVTLSSDPRIAAGTRDPRRDQANRLQYAKYLAKFIQYMLDDENDDDDQPPDVEEAEIWLSRLRAIAPRDFVTIQLTAQVLMAQKRYTDLLTMVEGYLNDTGLEEDEKERRVVNSALLLENMAALLNLPGPVEEAETRSSFAVRFLERSASLYDMHFQQSPRDWLSVAAFYARQNRIGKALDLLEREWRSGRPNQIMTITAMIITSGKTSVDDWPRAEKVLRDALVYHDRPVVLLLGLADLQSWRETVPAEAKDECYDEAEVLYREVLEKEPRNPVAMNNLALLLALRGGREQEPLRLINQAIASAGNDPALLDSRATIYMALGEPQKAAADLVKALQGRETALGLFHVAQVKQRMGQLKEARQRLAQALDTGLVPEALHPLERPFLKQLQSELL